MALYKLEDPLSNFPAYRIPVQILLEANCVYQFEAGVKNFIVLIQDISDMRMKPCLDGCPSFLIGWTTCSTVEICYQQLCLPETRIGPTIVNTLVTLAHRYERESRHDALVN